MRLTYVFRETGGNLRRNFTLFLATVVAVWISLALFGSSLLVRDGVDQATGRWRDGVEFIVFMNVEADPTQHEAMVQSLDENPEVQSWFFVDQDATFIEFQDEFADSPELLESIQPGDLPPSYRVRPTSTDADVVESLVSQFDLKPGVREVVASTEIIRSLEDTSRDFSLLMLVASIIVLVASVLLIFNTIRTAIFARRRDIEVMKLVGASNWYIRVPFMVEGTVQGLVGAAAAIPVLFVVNNLFEGFVRNDELALLRDFALESSVVWEKAYIVLLLGGLIGAVGSAFAVGRFLDV
ncbi:MAG: permease-like cell division protein FtsX [Acidimicrobiales bacterium]